MEDTVDSRVSEILEHYDNLLENELTFQQEGAHPQNAFNVRQCLVERFPGQDTLNRHPQLQSNTSIIFLLGTCHWYMLPLR